MDTIFFERLSAIANNSENFEELWGYFDLINNLPSHTYFHSFIMYSQYKLQDILDYIHKKNKITIQSVNKNINSFKVIPFDKFVDANYIFLIPLKNIENVYQIFMISDSHFSDLVENKIVEQLYPISIPTFFKQTELISAIKNFSKQFYSLNLVLVTDIVSKGKHKSPLNEQYIYTNRSWKRELFERTLLELNEKNEWISSIRLEWIKKKQGFNSYIRIAECRISKFGKISYSGNPRDFNDSLVHNLGISAKNRLDMLSNRGLREREFKPSPPLEILYDRQLFNSVSEIHRLGKVLGSYPNSSIAVLHANPYYHASIADYVDGSSFNIWVLSPSRILIKPQIKTSTEALERIISYISTEFSEGEINEYSG